MKYMELIFKYKNIINTKSNHSFHSESNINFADITNSLIEFLKEEENFLTVKEIIFDMVQYPIFIYCAKSYPQHFYERFKSQDNKLYKRLFSFMVNEMIYLNSHNLEGFIIENKLTDIPDITSTDTLYISKLLAVKYYNNKLFNKIYTNAAKYFKLYCLELDKLNSISDEYFIHNFYNLFTKSNTYHIKLKMINNLYSLLDGKYKDHIKLIIDTFLNSPDTQIAGFREEFENLNIAYNYKNAIL